MGHVATKSVFADLPASAFPFTIEFLRTDTGEVLWSTVATGPGGSHIPKLGSPDYRLMCRMTFANGEVVEALAPPYVEAAATERT